MSNNEFDKEIEGHEYDGIKEYDNPLPRWWLIIFWGTIVFAAGYYAYYQLGSGPTLQQELEVAMANMPKPVAPVAATPTESDEELTAAFASINLADGKAQYDGKCAACHGQELQGLIGPNLTDNYWLHGKGTPSDIVKVVRVGVADKGMPAWENMLKKEEIYAVTAYIISKKGSNPAGAKAPQGELVQ